MPDDLILRLLTISVTTSIVILALSLLAPYLNKTYAAKWKYWIWLALAIRLIIPVNFSFPAASVNVAVPDTNIGAFQPAVPIINRALEIVGSENPDRPFLTDSGTSITLLNMVSAIWLIGTALFLIIHFTKYYTFRKTILRWSKAPKNPQTKAAVTEIAGQIGLTQNILVLTSSKVSSPLMIGFFRPKLFLPHEKYSDSDLSFIIQHELTHCKRKDLWYKLLLLLANALHWFNPIAYLMFREASADLERSCDDVIVNGKSFETRKAYTETILASIRHERIKENALSTHFYGGMRTMKDRLVNILNTGTKRRGKFALVVVLLCSLLAGGLVACTSIPTSSTANGNKVKQTIQPAENQDADQTDDINSHSNHDYEVIAVFGRDFINSFNGAVAQQESAAFGEYISNENLLAFTNKMLELTQKQDLNGHNMVNYGAENEFGDAELKELEKNLYYLKLPFSFEGSGMTCQLLVQTEGSALKIADFYFGTKDGIDTLATGHHTVREVSDPELWTNEKWVAEVFEKLVQYEAALNS